MEQEKLFFMTTPHKLRRPAAFVLFVLLLFASLPTSVAQRRRPTAPLPPADRATTKPVPSRSNRPRLALVIVVDQFRYDYLERYGDLFDPRGIGRLLREGAS